MLCFIMVWYALYPMMYNVPAITGAAIEVPDFEVVEQLDILLTACDKKRKRKVRKESKERMKKSMNEDTNGGKECRNGRMEGREEMNEERKGTAGKRDRMNKGRKKSR